MQPNSLIRRFALPVVVLALVAATLTVVFQRDPDGNDAAVPTPGDGPVETRGTEADSETVDGARTADVEIRVLEHGDEGLPIAAAALELAHRPFEVGAATPGRRTATTDAEGKATLSGLPAGEWRVVARARGHFGTARVFAIRAVGGVAPHRWDLDLQAVARIEGVVRAPGGDPCAGAIARVIVPDPSNRSRALLHPDDREEARRDRWTTDAEGRFSIRVAPIRARFTLVLDHPERGRSVVEIPALDPGTVHEVDQELAPHTEIVGRVPRGPGHSTAVTVECWHASDDGVGLIAEHKTPAAADGSFRLRRLTGGRKRVVSITRSGDSIEIGTLETVAPSGETTDVGLVVSGTSRVLVSVVTDEAVQPAREAVVTVNAVLAAADAAHVPLSLAVALGHEVEIVGLPAATLVIGARLLDGAGPHLDPGYDEANGRAQCDGVRPIRVDLVIPRVVRAPAGSLVAEIRPPAGVAEDAVDAHVALLRGGAVVTAFARPWLGGREFRFGRLPPGDYQVVAVANGHRSPVVPVTVVEEREGRVVLASWSPAESVRGRVVDAEGCAITGAGVVVTAPSTDEALGRIAVLEVDADDGGRFEFPALPEVGGLVAVARTSVGTTPTVPLRWDAPDPQIELRVPAGGR